MPEDKHNGQPPIGPMFRQYRLEIANTIYKRLGSRDLASDLTQEVFVRVLAAARHSPIENPRAFLHQVARNLIVDHLRKKASERITFDEQPGAQDTLDTSPSVEQQIIDRREFERFKKVVESLPLKCRQVFILRKIEGLSYGDIAKKLNMSKAAVEKQIVRGLKSCREQLGRHN